jgi:hypothetical protein
MKRAVHSLAVRLRRYMIDDRASATLEFVLALPVVMAVFTASFESGLIMTRAIMLEQALDKTMRELRLGHYPIPSHQLLKSEICARSSLFRDCESSILIELQRINTATWALPATDAACIDRTEDIQPVTALQVGQQNDIMLIRVCIVQDLMFPRFGIGKRLPQDGLGGFGIVAVSAFVNEPT